MGIVDQVEPSSRSSASAREPTAPFNARTSVMTHVAWAPPKWATAARRTLAGLEERHPSRTILLLPEPSKPDGIDVTVSIRCYALQGVSREVCSEIVELRLRGKRSQVPASIVEPLLISDLPTFCRWRGMPPWGAPELDQLVDVCDRLVVDSSEWRGLPQAYAELAGLFDRIAVSDIAWGRSLGWRGAARVPLARHRVGAEALGDRPEGGRGAARRLAALAAAGGRSSSCTVRRACSSASPSTARRCGRRRGGRRARATCSPPSSTSSPATRSTRPRSRPPERQ